MKLNSDVDIDLADRDRLLALIPHTPASMLRVNPPRKHNTGVYVTAVPRDDLNDRCGIDYADAEARGYFKLDLLNVHVYSEVRDEQHLKELMREPDWTLLQQRKWFEQIIHIGNHYSTLKRMPEPINSIPRMAMFMAIIRPAKRHLIGQSWAEVAKTIWEKDEDGYQFKKAHGVAYAHLAVVHMNLLAERANSGHSTD